MFFSNLTFMNHLLKTTVLVFLLLLCGTAGAISIDVKYTAIANFIYQLDCVSGYLGNCSDKNYNTLWSKEFLKDDADKEFLKTWAHVMRKYRLQIELTDEEKVRVGSRYNGIDIPSKLRILSFNSSSKEEYLSRLDLIFLHKDKIQVEAIVNHFYPRFKLWWNKVAATKGNSFASQTDKLLKKPSISKNIESFAHFYQVQLPDDYHLPMNLFYRPEFIDEPTSGEQVESYSATEFVLSETPEKRLDVVLHEMCHFFFNNTTSKNLLTLQKQFSDQGRLSATAAFNLLNETLATTFGNGIINKQLMPKETWDKYIGTKNSFYNQYYVDKAAKAIMPMMETYISEKKTLYDDSFVKTYISELKKAFGNELEAPSVLLNDTLLLEDEEYKHSFFDEFRKIFYVSRLNSGTWKDKEILDAIKTEPNHTTLIIVHPKKWSHLSKNKILTASDVQKLETTYKKNKGVLFARKKSPSAMLYVVAGDSVDKITSLLKKLESTKTGVEGFLETERQ